MTAAQRTRSKAAQPSEQVRTYLTALSSDARQHLQKLRATIRAAEPAAVESLSYGIPAFRLDGKWPVWYARVETAQQYLPTQHGDDAGVGEGATRLRNLGEGDPWLSARRAHPDGRVKQLVRARIAELRGKKKSA